SPHLPAENLSAKVARSGSSRWAAAGKAPTPGRTTRAAVRTSRSPVVSSGSAPALARALRREGTLPTPVASTGTLIGAPPPAPRGGAPPPPRAPPRPGRRPRRPRGAPGPGSPVGGAPPPPALVPDPGCRRSSRPTATGTARVGEAPGPAAPDSPPPAGR